MELSGSIPDLPPGFSFSPGQVINSDKERMKEIDAIADTMSSVFPLKEHEYVKIKIPEGASGLPPRIIEAFTSDPRRIPYGFMASSPHPGYDPERLDKTRLKQNIDIDAGIKSSEIMSTIPHGYTSKRVPVLWPIKDVYFSRYLI